VPIVDSPIWGRLDDTAEGEVRRHTVAWQLSQLMHGEQGALVCTSKIVSTVPDMDFLIQRIVPVLRDIGLFGPRIRAAFEDMGVMGFAETDLDALVAEDEAVAQQFDRMAHVEQVAGASESTAAG
jgi:hypothetical protein